MPDSPAPTKWWASSITIWGAVVTAVSTVLPVVGPLLGIDIPPELIHQLGDQVILLAQAAGGVAGDGRRGGRGRVGRQPVAVFANVPDVDCDGRESDHPATRYAPRVRGG